MGKSLKLERLQELEEINQQIQKENSELRRLLRVFEDENQKLQLELQAKDELLENIQKADKKDEEESIMSKRLSSTIDSQFFTEECSVSESPFSLSSHQKVDNSLSEFEKHTHGYWKGFGIKPRND
jgi:predicted O-linked N-acetylglucosamine transferase (SPINDLY family)